MRLHAGRTAPARRPPASTLLVVDAVAASRDITAMLARHCGYEVFAAASFSEAMHLARAVRPDGIVAELLRDPRHDRTIVGALRNDAATARIPVLVLSAASSRDQALREGAAAFLDRPLDGAALRDALAEHVGAPLHAGPSPLAAA
ncbi:MAG TPA: hypothetical protein VFS20_14680 [Longimicrobium sp.]|nr:hypothetical protein [Longimicrobium sp.]